MWLIVATIAQIILGSSAVFDKLLIVRRSIEPLVYAFWVGILGAVALALLPFGLREISWALIGTSLVSGVCFIAAFFFLYRVLQRREASELFPLVGAISPIITLILAGLFLRTVIQGGEMFGFLFLVAGGFFIYWSEEKRFRSEIVVGAFVSSVFFALSYVLAKIVFQETNFLTGFFWTKMGGVIAAGAVLFSTRCRQKIFQHNAVFKSANALSYFLNRAYAGVGSAMLSYAVFLANPALVDVTQNLKFIAIFITARVLTKERFSGVALVKKIVAIAFISIGLLWLSAETYIRALPVLSETRPIEWGVTFSPKFARQLGLDPREAFSAIMRDLRPRKIRLVAYWDGIERVRGEYDFSEIDWQLESARVTNPDIILALGLKVPRWPECHAPPWAKDLSVGEREQALRAYLSAVINRYKNNPLIRVWQVENEPYLMFGQCPRREDEFLDKEINLVKSLDPTRLVLTTDGGEFGLWYKAARAGDIFGTTMYRSVYPKYIGPIFGTIEYPLAPSYFRLKEQSIRWFNRGDQKPYIVIELQAEPWGSTEIQNLSYEEGIRLFSPEYFRETIAYAKQTGFSSFYLWGAEWWYQLKKEQNDSRIWEETQALFRTNR